MGDELMKTEGTPITRDGGYFIRVGFNAAGYRVDQKTERKCRWIKSGSLTVATLLLLTLVFWIELGQVLGISPGIKEGLPYSYTVNQLLLAVGYLAGIVLVFGLHWLVSAKLTEMLVAEKTPFDEGMSLLEQRRKANGPIPTPGLCNGVYGLGGLYFILVFHERRFQSRLPPDLYGGYHGGPD